MILIKKTETPEEKDAHFEIRKKVFQDEQKVSPKDDVDKYDKSHMCRYYLAYYNTIPVGAARWRESKAGYKLERICILPEYRGKGIGTELVKSLIAEVPQNLKVYLGAQDYCVGFYESLGFKVKGEAYWEANILHRFMKYDPIKQD